MSIQVIDFELKDDEQAICGQSTFNLLAVEELYKAVATGSPSALFGIAFSEGSDNRILRVTGNDDYLMKKSSDLIKKINAGHYYIILMKNAYPIQVLNNIKLLSTTVNIQVASGNDIRVITYKLADVSSVIGFTDGLGPQSIENEETRTNRRDMIRAIGYLEKS